LQILPNAGSNSGGDLVQIYGYGFGSDATKITVKIGAANATVTKIESITGIAPSLAWTPAIPFRLERITIQSPPGLRAKRTLSSPAPPARQPPRIIQYLQSAQSYSKPGFFRFLLYDQARQRIYLTNIDHVDAFDLQLNSFALQFNPPGGPPPNAGLRGMALTPDGSQLIVADFGAQKDLSPRSSERFRHDRARRRSSRLHSNSGPARVAATSAQTVFVGLSGEGGSGGACSTCLAQLNLAASPPTIQPAPQPKSPASLGLLLFRVMPLRSCFCFVWFFSERTARCLGCKYSKSVCHFGCECFRF